MEKTDVKNLMQLREYIRNYYQELPKKYVAGNVEHDVAFREVTTFCATLINSLDDLLKDHVDFT
tara:strand:+ start:2223 stop:2414 length:192 start_codon:yes stop_codon:yes gene_type:complete